MREIIFRGKRIDNGEWAYGSLWMDDFQIEECESVSISWWSDEKTVWNREEVVTETIGQFTGLNDKNGTKIFEGDILQFDYIGKNLGVNGISLVSFQNGKFGVEWGYHKEFVCLDGFANTTLEVIGNIRDNPELLGNK